MKQLSKQKVAISRSQRFSVILLVYGTLASCSLFWLLYVFICTLDVLSDTCLEENLVKYEKSLFSAGVLKLLTGTVSTNPQIYSSIYDSSIHLSIQLSTN